MAKANQEVISMLGQLIEVCESCEALYLKAVEKEPSEAVQEQYRQHTAEMVRCVSELKTEMAKLGENLKLAKRDEEEKVSENPLELGAEEQEKEAFKLYQEALRMDLPPNISAMLRRHLEILKGSHETSARNA